MIIVSFLLFLNGLVNNSMRITRTLRKKEQLDIEMQTITCYESKMMQTEDPSTLPILLEEPSTSLEN